MYLAQVGKTVLDEGASLLQSWGRHAAELAQVGGDPRQGLTKDGTRGGGSSGRWLLPRTASGPCCTHHPMLSACANKGCGRAVPAVRL